VDQHRSEITFDEGANTYLFATLQANLSQRQRPPETSTQILWHILGSSMHWSGRLQIGTSTIFQDTPSISCIISREICWSKFHSSNHITIIG